ncbi:hypothetical protein [Kitasatospora sp. NPDC088783]|uniref:hypothetical protein n=1 Tax=Kitasatospora sp. NPDC088783 TaxID=3364077 RepID=UPI00380F4484
MNLPHRSASKYCPHRLCLPFHTAALTAMAAATVRALLDLHGWGPTIVTLAAAVVAVPLLTALALRINSRQAGGGSNPVQVHNGWARAALWVDTLYLAAAVLLAARPHPAAGAPGATRQGLAHAGTTLGLSLLVVVGLAALWGGVHLAATRTSRTVTKPAGQPS